MKNILVIIAALWLTSSCVEPIDLNLNEGDNLKVVVDAVLSNDPMDQYVILTLSSNYIGEESIQYAKGATATVTNGEDSYPLEERENGRYYFTEPMEIHEGDTITLDIEYDGKESTAMDVVHRTLVIDKLSAEIIGSIEEETEDGELVERPIYSIITSIQEPEGPGDFYLFSIVPKHVTEELKLDYMFSVNDDMVDGAYIEDIEISSGTYEVGDTVVIEVYGISKEAFDYIQSVDNAVYNQGGLFSPPPANVGTNLSGAGAKGFFMAGMKNSYEIVIE